jgi:hypothetical protein
LIYYKNFCKCHNVPLLSTIKYINGKNFCFWNFLWFLKIFNCTWSKLYAREATVLLRIPVKHSKILKF